MKLKKFAIRGLIVLAIGVALCMFFARTVLRITTPKVSLAEAQNGRLDHRIALVAKLYFPDPEPMFFEEAAQYSVNISRVYIRSGFPVKEGDLLFTTTMPDFQTKMDEFVAAYDTEFQKLVALETANRRSRARPSAQNELYDKTLASQTQLAEARTSARAHALREGIALPDDINDWRAAAMDADEATRNAVANAIEKNIAHYELAELLYKSYDDSKVRVSSDLFKYINDRGEHYKKLSKIEADMTRLEVAKLSLAEVRASRDGFIIDVKIQEGDLFDGKKAAFTLNNLEKPPVLRAEVSATERTIEKGSKASVRGSDRYSEWNTTVVEVGVNADGKRFVDLEIIESELRNSGGLYAMVLQRETATYNVYITQRAMNSTTLIPAGALHEEGGETFIFVVDRYYGWSMGFTDESMKVRKMTVTVLDKSDKLVAIAEDLYGGEKIAYREDRALSDGISVMEHIN